MPRIKFIDNIIRFGFYLLFFFVPLIFLASTSELFEFNKMLTVYVLTIVITSAWVVKMIISGKIIFRRTFLDIPLGLYLLSHILSTIFSVDRHVSLWGYYSRFHEGLIATLSYILLYYAAVSNLNRSDVLRIVWSSFASAVIVSVWGILEHFGHSISCLIITGQFDVACWIQDVKNRVFATLGQPNWMAAYLCVLILVSLGFGRKFLIFAAVFFAALLCTKSRSGYAGLAVGIGSLIALWLFQYLRQKRNKLGLAAITFGFVVTVITGSLVGWHWYQNLPTPGPGITESEAIRKPVWEGAIKIWQRYPVFGSGVETFAYSFYLDRPASKNLDSEWDFLYNKAHNEYLNLLATTGTVGIVTYFSVILTFIFWIIYNLKFTIHNSNHQMVLGLAAAYISILITNFFGFSVVIIGLYFFLIPAFAQLLNIPESSTQTKANSPSATQWVLILATVIVTLFMELSVYNKWEADRAYNQGKNRDLLNLPDQFILANSYLTTATQLYPEEPTFHSELSYNEAVLASLLYTEIAKATDSAIASLSAETKMNLQLPSLGQSTGELVQKAIGNSDTAVQISPNALTFWKDRTKTFYQLSVIDPKYNQVALEAIQTAANLAPTDAKVHYNLGLILDRSGQKEEAKKVFEETLVLKPDYTDVKTALETYIPKP